MTNEQEVLETLERESPWKERQRRVDAALEVVRQAQVRELEDLIEQTKKNIEPGDRVRQQWLKDAEAELARQKAKR